MLSIYILSALIPDASALSYASGKSYSAGSFSSTNDNTTLECFGDAVENYSTTGSSNLNYPIDEVSAFLGYMSSTASYYSFYVSPYANYIFYTDSTAWSTDFEKLGKDNVYNDNNVGVHWILGMDSDMDDTATVGTYFGWYVRSGYTIHEAWMFATQDAMSSSRTGADVQFYTGYYSSQYDNAAYFNADPKSGSGTLGTEWTL